MRYATRFWRGMATGCEPGPKTIRAQPVVVENPPSARGIVASQAGASARPDGYTRPVIVQRAEPAKPRQAGSEMSGTDVRALSDMGLRCHFRPAQTQDRDFAARAIHLLCQCKDSGHEGLQGKGTVRVASLRSPVFRQCRRAVRRPALTAQGCAAE